LAIAQKEDLSETVARVLAGRGVSPADAISFLSPTVKELMPDPSTLTDMDKAVDRLANAVQARQRVAIFGDYDVDGAASAALLKRVLDHFGVLSEIYIPDRIFEGYGPNRAAIDALIDRGCDLIVTVDCGSTSDNALEHARARGIDVMVLDHHQVGVQLPPCIALVNPNREDDLSGLGYLCAAGVTFLTLVALLRELRKRNHPGADNFDLLSMLDLVALATVCDVVPLKGLNRAFVVKGLAVLRRMHNPGLAALMRVSGVDGPVTPYHLGFIIGPRLNAGGRIGDAAQGSRLLAISDSKEALDIAQNLDRLNVERQKIEKATLSEAEAEVFAEIGEGDPPVVVLTAGEGWHPGIVGLIAARLKEKLHRPAIAIAFDPTGTGTGSGRSISGFDIGRMVRAAVDEGLLVKGGGHAMAAGMTVERANMGRLRAWFEEFAQSQVNTLAKARTLKIDAALTASGAMPALIEQLEQAGPYGAGHPQPVFALPSHRVADVRVVGSDHVKLRLVDALNATIDAIAFRCAETELGRQLLEGRGEQFHFAGTLSNDHWNGRRRVQLRVVDAAPFSG
jgi:single-stranded-DNA-specific exonuclease